MNEQHQTSPTGKTTPGQVIKFTFFSISAGLIQLGSFYLFNNLLGFPYWLGYSLSLILSVLWNFTFNRRYTFRSDMNVPKAMVLVALFYLVFTPVSTWLGDIYKSKGVNEYIILGITMLINFVTEFLYQRYVVYRHSVDTNQLAKNNS